MENMNTIVSLYIAAKKAESDAKKEKEKLASLIKQFAGNALFFETDDYIVNLKKTISIRLDTDSLYQDFPDIKETYKKETESVSINPIEKCKAKSA